MWCLKSGHELRDKQGHLVERVSKMAPNPEDKGDGLTGAIAWWVISRFKHQKLKSKNKTSYLRCP